MNHADYRAKRREDPGYVEVEARMQPLLDLANDVLRLRLERGWTQRDLAKRIGTRQANISRLESGLANPTVKTLEKLSDVLGKKLVVRLDPHSSETEQARSPATVGSDAAGPDHTGTEWGEVDLLDPLACVLFEDRSTRASPVLAEGTV